MTPKYFYDWLKRLTARVANLEARTTTSSGSSSSSSVIRGTGNPNGVTSATGAAIYLDVTTPSAPVIYWHTDAGTSTVWVS